jgi:DNA-binding Lrp family transcriptional regulator
VRVAELFDELDQRIVAELGEVTAPNILELARRLGVARNTVQARLDRLSREGIIEGYGAVLGFPAMGYDVLAFTTLEVAQGGEAELIEALSDISEVLEVHKVTGPGDLMCRIVATSNRHLHAVLERVLAAPGVVRATTALVLTSPVERLRSTAPVPG